MSNQNTIGIQIVWNMEISLLQIINDHHMVFDIWMPISWEAHLASKNSKRNPYPIQLNSNPIDSEMTFSDFPQFWTEEMLISKSLIQMDFRTTWMELSVPSSQWSHIKYSNMSVIWVYWNGFKFDRVYITRLIPVFAVDDRFGQW